MNDLLGDTAGGRVSDLEMGPSSSSASTSSSAAPGQDRGQFLQEVNDVTGSMDEVRKRLTIMQNSNEDYKTVTSATAMKVIKEKMDKDLDEISVIAGELKRNLKALDRSNAANREIMNCQAGSSTDRTRMSITSNVKTRLRRLTVNFQELRQRFQDEFREEVQRRLSTVTGNEIDESVIERLIETGDSEQIFQNAVLPHGRGEVLDRIAEIQERHDAVKDIERKLLELHQIFLDMETVEEPQGELLDNIEAEMGNPVEPAAALAAQIRSSISSLRNRTYKYLCIIIIIILLLVIVLVIIVLEPWKKKTKSPD